MAKEQEKRTVLVDWTKNDFSNYGQATVVRKYWIPNILFIIMLFVVWYCGSIIDNGAMQWVSSMGILAWWLVIAFVVLPIVGNRYWKSTKDKKQPILMERLPSWFWWRNKK